MQIGQPNYRHDHPQPCVYDFFGGLAEASRCDADFAFLIRLNP